MAKICSTGIAKAVKSVVKDKPWFSYKEDQGLILIKSSPNLKIDKRKSIGVANTLSKQLNKAINSGGVHIGDVFFSEFDSEGWGRVRIAPNSTQLELLNYSPEELKEMNEILAENERNNLVQDSIIRNLEGQPSPFYLEPEEQVEQLYAQYLSQNLNGSVEQFKSWVDNNQSNVQYQLPQGREMEEFVASEKTIRDLAARMSDRIGIPVRFESDRTKKYKGKLENGTAIVNLAYATLDTPIHEILGHPIIREILKNNNTLYQNLLKELEYGKGKEVFDRIKRDYQIKSKPEIIELESMVSGGNTYQVLGKEFDNKEDAVKYQQEQTKYYTLEEQQEEAIVELLGLYTAGKLDNVKDGKLISLLKRLLKEMKQFVRSLINQKEVEIDKLPDNMTLGDIADLLAYSNSKLILPGNEVVYTTPDNQQFKTYQEASNHISELAKSVEDVDLSDTQLPIRKKVEKASDIPVNEFIDEFDNTTFIKKNNNWYEKVNNILVKDENIVNIWNSNLSDTTVGKSGVEGFIEKNKEYEQSKEIVEKWKKVNNIQYNPEEVYSRGQEFVSVVGAYSDFDVNLMMQNLLSHIEDNQKAGGEFTISAFTKPVDKQIGHLEGGGGKIKFKIYPQSQDIKWAANIDVYSGSVWDASEKVNKDKKSELLGVSYSKYPSLSNVNTVQPNLASIVDNLAHHHNELGISLTGSNFRLEYDEDIPHTTKKIINSINSILDQKYGKLVKPEIKGDGDIKFALKSELNNNVISIHNTEEEARIAWKKLGQDRFTTKITKSKKYSGIQPTQTNETLKESIDSVKNKNSSLKENEWAIEPVDENEFGVYTFMGIPIQLGFSTIKEANEWLNKNKPKEKEYTEQALINTKIAKLKEVAKKYPRSLIRSEVRPISNSSTISNLGFAKNELPFQKVSESPSSIHFEPEEGFHYFDPADTKSKSVFQNYIDFKRSQVRLLEQKLAEIRNEKRLHKTNLPMFTALTRAEQELKMRLEGDVDRGIKGLRQEIGELLKGAEVEAIGYYVERDLERLSRLVQSENAKDLQEAKELYEFYIATGTFVKGEPNPFFEDEDLFFEDGSLQLDESILGKFREWRKRAEEYKSKAETQSEKVTTNAVNENSKVRNLYGDKKLTFEEIISKKDGLKDLNFIDMWMMDITSGIFSSNGLIPQVMMDKTNRTFEQKTGGSKSIEARIDALQSKVEKILKSMGFGLSALGIGQGVSYKLFQQVDKKGFQTGRLAHRYSKEFFDTRSNMEAEHKRLLEAADLEEDASKKSKLYAKAFQQKKSWFLKNVIILDMNKIPEIINDPEFSNYSSTFEAEIAEEYKKYLISVIGEKGYREEVAKQKEQLKAYEVAKQVFTENILAESGKATVEELSEKDKAAITNWELRNSPFKGVEDHFSVEGLKMGDRRVYNFMNYNISIPRKTEATPKIEDGKYKLFDTTKETGFYDSNYAKIEADDTLKEFYDLMFEAIKTIRNTMPAEIQKEMTVNQMPALRKNIMEILMDENTSFFKSISLAAKEIYDRIIKAVRVIKQSQDSYSAIDVITGKPKPHINTSFFETNFSEINRQYALEKARFMQAFNLGRVKEDSLDTINSRTSLSVEKLSGEALRLVANYLNVEASHKAITDALGSTSIPIKRIMRDFVTNTVAQQQSFDLPKIVKLYSHLAMEYAARQEVLPILSIMKEHYMDIKAPSSTNTGESIKNSLNGGKTRMEGYRTNANKQFEDWWNRVILNNYDTKHIGVVEAINKFKPKTKKEKAEHIANTLTGKSVKYKKYTSQEKEVLKDIDRLISTETNPERLEELQSIRNSLGGNFSATKFFDALLDFVRLKGLGWNLSSQVTNLAEGTISNMIVAASGDYFEPHLIYEGYHVVKGSFLKNIGIKTKGAKKAAALMQKYRVLQDASNELQKASTKSNFSWVSKLSPYELIRRVEYINQAPLMIAMLKHTKLPDGTAVWDALDENGKLLPKYATEENKKNWENAEGKEYMNFKTTLTKAIVFGHGNYDDKRGMMAKSTIMGKALLMFKTWITSAFYQRFAATQDDLESGVKGFYGRYWSYTPASGAIAGAMSGMLFFGPIGGLIGGAIGTGLTHAFGKNTGQNFFKEFLYTNKMMFKKFTGIPVNLMAGKNVINSNGDFQEMVGKGNFTERDAKNMRANMADLSIMMGWMVLILIAKAALYDDDEKEEERPMHNLLVNRFMQLSSQAAMYTNPLTMKETIMDMAVVKLFEDIGKTMTAFNEYIQGDDILASGINSGSSRLAKEVKKTFLPGIFRTESLGFGTQLQRQFENSPIDDWFKADNNKLRKRVQGERAALRKELLESGMDEKAVEKQVNRELPMPKKDKKNKD
jgi:hypothetical protein